MTTTRIYPARDKVNQEQGKFAVCFASAPGSGTYIQHMTIPEMVQANQEISAFLDDACTCALGDSNGTTIMECVVHANSETARLERTAVERRYRGNF